MKNFFKAIGKAILYFAVYIIVQLVISFTYGIVWTIIKIMEITASGQEPDNMLLTQQLTEQLLNDTMMLTFLTGAITLLIYWISIVIRKKKFLKEVEIKAIPVKEIWAIVVAGLSLNVIISVVLSVIPWPQEWLEAYVTSAGTIDASMLAWVTTVIMAPILEEILFRGLIYTRLKKGMPALVAALVASLVFGIMHGTIIWALYAFVIGMVMTWIFERYQSLTANILFHMAFNTMGMIISMIPEEVGFVVWILFAVGVVAMIFACRHILRYNVPINNIGEEQNEETN